MNRAAWEQRQRRDKEIIKLLRKGMPDAAIVKKLAVTKGMIYHAAKQANLFSERQQQKADIIKDLIRGYKKGKSEKQLAAKHQIPEYTVRFNLKKNLPGYISSFQRKITKRNSTIIKQYQSGLRPSVLAHKFQLSVIRVKRILISAGVFEAMKWGRPKAT